MTAQLLAWKTPPCQRCGTPTRMMGATLCDACLELPQALDAPAELKRAELLLESVVLKVLNKLLLRDADKWRTTARLTEYLRDVFAAGVSQQCKAITEAAKVKPYAYRQLDKRRRQQARKSLADELRDARRALKAIRRSFEEERASGERLQKEAEREQRSRLACDLRNARRTLKNLRDSIDEIHLVTAKQRQHEPCTHEMCPQPWPVPPSGFLTPHREGDGLPSAPGIYFLWSDARVVYVGQSTSLVRRLCLASHHILREQHLISFLEFDRKYLTWAECYYIGILRPVLNFGQNASHHRANLDSNAAPTYREAPSKLLNVY